MDVVVTVVISATVVVAAAVVVAAGVAQSSGYPDIGRCHFHRLSQLAVAGGNKNLAFEDGHGMNPDSDGVRTVFESKSRL